MTILTDKFVLENFGVYQCPCHGIRNWSCPCSHLDVPLTCEAIVKAMEKPLKRGTLYLFYSVDYPGTWVVQTQNNDDDYFHPFKLVLPDSKQTKPDLVEEKIKEIVSFADNILKVQWDFTTVLRELVSIARKEK